MRKYFLLYVLVGMLLSSCISKQYVFFEVQEPAKVTLPADIARVVVVNNAVPQLPEAGVERTYTGGNKKYEMKPLEFDSLAFIMAETLAYTMDRNNYFNEVMVYNNQVRTDDEWLANVALSDEFKQMIFDEESIDGILAINKVLVNLTEKVDRNGFEGRLELAGYIDMKVKITAQCAFYTYNRENPVTSFIHSDSLLYKEAVQAPFEFIFFDIPQIMLEEFTAKTGAQLAYYFVPSWIEIERLFYTGSARMREAYSYFGRGKWNESESVLRKEYDKNTKEETLAQLAADLALVFEAQDRYADALSWANLANTHLANGKKIKKEDKEYIDSYIAQLHKRITDSKKLDLQYGVEE
jgi:hypothetical protein